MLYKNFPEFLVLYQRGKAPYRNWDIQNLDMQHPHVNGNGLYLNVLGFNFFSSLGLLKIIIFKRPTLLILGLGWNDIDALVIILLKKLRLTRAKIVFWSEANYLTNGARKDNAIKRVFRRSVYNQSDFQAISGRMTLDTLERWGVKRKESIRLPNCIQEDVFSDIRPCPGMNKKILVLVAARLVEPLKGIINFIDAIPQDRFKHIDIRVAGDGVDKAGLLSCVSERGLESCITVMGELSPLQLASEMKVSDVFCLPSFSDPSPLVVNEALCAGLPLLISIHCGNHFECVRNYVNGVTFNPYDSEDIVRALDFIISNKIKLADMGRSSRKIYNEQLSANKIICDFLSDVRKVVTER